MSQPTHVSDIMTRGVRSLDVRSKPSDVRRALVTNECHHLPILDRERLVGIVSWRDLVGAYRELRNKGLEDPIAVEAALDRDTRVADLMTEDPITVRPEDEIERVIDLIADGSLHSVLVVDAADELVGIVTSHDLLQFFAS